MQRGIGPEDPGLIPSGRHFFVTGFDFSWNCLALRVACAVAAWRADLILLGMVRALSRLCAFVLAFGRVSGRVGRHVFVGFSHANVFCGGAMGF